MCCGTWTPYTRMPNATVSSVSSRLTMIEEITTPSRNTQLGSGVPRRRLRMPESRRIDSDIAMFVKHAPITPSVVNAGM